MKYHRRFLTVLATALLASVSIATATTTTPETFRCELGEFVEGLRGVPSLGIDSTAAERVAELSAPELEAMEAALTAIPRWQQLPAVLASLDAASAEHDRAMLGRLIARGGLLAPQAASAEMTVGEFRADFLFLIDQIGRFAPLVEGDFGARVQHVRETIAGASTEAMEALRAEYYRRAGELEQRLHDQMIVTGPLSGSLGGGSSFRTELTGHCGSCCDDVITCVGCWIDLVGCLIGEAISVANSIANFISDFFTQTIPNLINQIAQLGTKALQWFTDVFNSVKNFVQNKFNEIKNALPQNINQVANWVLAKTGIDLNNINWSQIAGSIPTISPPCPSGQALEIIGAVCDSGANALTELLYSIMPDDGLSLAFKLGAAVVHFPLAYLCQCVDIKSAHDYADAQELHRDHTKLNLNARLGTRATQTSVNGLNASLINLDGDVAKAEAKLDVLEATAGRIESNVNRIEATAVRTEATTNRIETNVNRTEATTDRTEAKVDALTQGNNDQHAFLADFSTLMHRLNIEENLLQNKPDTISFFQLPAAFGGKLEVVSGVVADTIRMNLDALQAIGGAEREHTRGQALLLVGDFVRAYEAFRSAYREAVK